MQFLVLGPLRVALADEEIPISATKHRTLLAVLVIHLNCVVSLERLVDELWERPPPTASNLVRQYISQLRKQLTAAGEPARLVTRGSGYALLADSRCTDVDAFEQLIHLAEDQLSTDRADQAQQTTERALQLWRGPAYGDVLCGSSVGAERERLEELRVSAQELGAKAKLAAGQVADAISELKVLTRHYPLREGLYADLMRALSVNGRKADALTVYRTAREVLTTELGLEPGRELRALEQLILSDDPVPPAVTVANASRPDARTAPIDVALAVSPTLPAQLADFVGRTAEIDRVERLLDRAGPADGAPASPPVVVLSGVPGIGKTALAVHLSHQLEGQFPDGQLFLHLRAGDGAPAEPEAVLIRAIGLLGGSVPARPLDLVALRDLYRGALADRRVLLVLDDAVDEKQVRWLLPGRSCGAVMITSRSRLAALDGAQHVGVPTFTTAEAVRLLALVAGQERIHAEPEASLAISEACGGLPLAVRVVAARLGIRPHRPLWQMAARLAGDSAFAELVVGDITVAEVIAPTFWGLGPEDRRLLNRLAQMNPVPATGPNRHLTIPERDLSVPDEVVDRLVEVGILEIAGYDRDGHTLFRCVELFRRYARACPDVELSSQPGLLGVPRCRPESA